VLKRLHALHLDVDVPPQATFYIWLNLEKLPPPLNNGLVSNCYFTSPVTGNRARQRTNFNSSLHQTFFEELLKEQTIVIPGIFFDINPAHRRNLFNSPCHHYVRLSFGPPMEDLDKGEFAVTLISHLVLFFLFFRLLASGRAYAFLLLHPSAYCIIRGC
jgi:aspartate/methionine/tyrosine aminotransferase